MHHHNQKNKNEPADFLNSDERTEQILCRATIKRNYVPKTDYSGFAPEQAVGEENGKKRGGQTIQKFNHACSRPWWLRGEGAKSGKRTEGQWIIQ